MAVATEHLAAALKSARRAAGLSQRALGARTGLPQGHVSRIEAGAVDPRLTSFVELARALGLEPVLVPRARLTAVRAVLRGARGPAAPRPAHALDDEDDGTGTGTGKMADAEILDVARETVRAIEAHAETVPLARAGG